MVEGLPFACRRLRASRREAWTSWATLSWRSTRTRLTSPPRRRGRACLGSSPQQRDQTLPPTTQPLTGITTAFRRGASSQLSWMSSPPIAHSTAVRIFCFGDSSLIPTHTLSRNSESRTASPVATVSRVYGSHSRCVEGLLAGAHRRASVVTCASWHASRVLAWVGE